MNPIKCPRCGKINDGTTDFCIYCGTIYDEYNAEEDDSNVFFIPTHGGKKQEIKLNPMPENLSSGKESYRWMIIIGYLFAILGSVLGFIFAIYLITRKDSNARKHGWFLDFHWSNGSEHYLKSIQYHKHDSNVQFKCNEHEWFQ